MRRITSKPFVNRFSLYQPSRFFRGVCDENTYPELSINIRKTDLFRYAYHPSNDHVLTLDRNQVNLWNLKTRTQIAELPLPQKLQYRSNCIASAFHPTDNVFAVAVDSMICVADYQGNVQFQCRNNSEIRPYEDHYDERHVCRLDFTPNGKHLIARTHSTVDSYDLTKGYEHLNLAKGYQRSNLIDSSYAEGGQIYVSPDSQKIIVLAQESSEYRKSWHHSGRFIQFYCRGGVYVFSPSVNKPSQGIHIDKQDITSISCCISPDSEIAALGAEGYSIFIVNLNSVSIVKTLTAGDFSNSNYSDGNISQVKFSPDNRWLVGASGDGRIFIWECETFKLTHSLGPLVPHAELSDIVFVDNQNFIFFVHFQIKQCHVKTGAVTHLYNLSKNIISRSLSLFRDGTLVCTTKDHLLAKVNLVDATPKNTVEPFLRTPS